MSEQGSLVRLQQEYDVTIDWRGFELHPETPEGGMLMSGLFAPDYLELMARNIQAMARDQGAGEIQVGSRLSNTRRALAVAELAREEDRLDPFRNAAMAAYWQHAADLEDDALLASVAEAVGLDGAVAVEASRSETYLGRVDAMRQEASSAGVTGIPTLHFGAGPVIVGAQPYDVLARAAKAAGASRR